VQYKDERSFPALRFVTVASEASLRNLKLHQVLSDAFYFPFYNQGLPIYVPSQWSP